MGNDRQPAPDVRFEVTVRPSPYNDRWSTRYVHFTARAVIAGTGRFGDCEGRPVIVAPDSSELPYSPAVRAYLGLIITAQADTDSLRRPGQEFYGQEVGFERSGPMKLDDMEAAVKILRRIRTGMDKLSDTLGRPQTTAQYATHVARALTAHRTPFAYRLTRDQDDYEGTGCRSMDPDALGWHLSSRCQDLRKKYGIEISE